MMQQLDCCPGELQIHVDANMRHKAVHASLIEAIPNTCKVETLSSTWTTETLFLTQSTLTWQWQKGLFGRAAMWINVESLMGSEKSSRRHIVRNSTVWCSAAGEKSTSGVLYVATWADMRKEADFVRWWKCLISWLAVVNAWTHMWKLTELCLPMHACDHTYMALQSTWLQNEGPHVKSAKCRRT